MGRASRDGVSLGRRLVTKLVIMTVVGTGAALTWTATRRGADDDCRQRVADAMRALPDYATHEGLYIRLLDAHHPKAFEETFKMQGRHIHVSLDHVGYARRLVYAMAIDAGNQGYAQQTEHLRKWEPTLIKALAGFGD